MNLLLLVSLLEIDLTTGQEVRRQWEPEKAIPVGSLSKPFLAFAYAQRHGFSFPKIRCHGCWKPGGHGELDIVRALALSCNRYFDVLRSQVPEEHLQAVVQQFGLHHPERAEPEQLLHAYIELYRRAEEPGVASILQGMRQAARYGTAQALGEDAYAKTGTAPCTHQKRAPGDGLAVVLYPASQPRRAVLVRVHGVPGSVAVRSAIKSLRSQSSTCRGCSSRTPQPK
ncbi:MAG: hypothetical protein NZV14_07905 [Bryobacteraceae bacterium]|nr:hypothetical protein [Bryobacteraceae bacterium]MDW8378070.1 hypothetical protein [Bryobacterales bacterium]